MRHGRFARNLGLSIQPTTEDTTILVDGVLHTRIECRVLVATMRQVLGDMDEEDISLTDDPIALGFWFERTGHFLGGRREEVLGGDGERSEQFSIQFLNSPRRHEIDGAPVEERGEDERGVILDGHQRRTLSS